MAMTDLYNSSDVRKFDYTVYISTNIINEAGATGFKNIANLTALNGFLGSYFKLGKLDRAVSYSTEDGETIVDNEQYENVITKTGSITAEHIAVDNTIVRQMRELDGTDISVVFVSKKGNKYHAILFPQVRYDYEETETSGNVQRLPFSVSKTIDNVASFRAICEF